MPGAHPEFGGFSFPQLLQADTLALLDRRFLQRLANHDPALHERLRAYRAGHAPPAVELSALLLGCAPLLEEFLAEFFGIQAELAALRERQGAHAAVFAFKKLFVLRRARRFRPPPEGLESFAELDAWLDARVGASADREQAVARLAQAWLADEAAHAEEIGRLTRWCVQAMRTPEGRAAVKNWVSFRLPAHTDHGKLVPVQFVPGDALARLEGPPEQRRQRQGFKLTDARMTAREVLGEIHYCIYCHDHEGDFCAKGFPEKKGEPELGLKKDPLGVTLTGCPLDEKISEMHSLKRDGHALAALAMVMADNPMCPATGHRICNDCMKACVYQKQTPVNVPQIETRVLTDVLELPWGVEIYDLLTRWNPLRQRQYLPRPYNGLKVLVAGQGPAGFTLAHHLLMEGCAVVGVDGLKIEPLPEHYVNAPIRDWSALCEELDARVMAGFGGVAEYGITVRWDKNFLKLIYLSLARRPYFQVYGGVRFGGTLSVEDAWELGFDHLAIAVGAGLPQALPIPGSMAPGMRQANDFLMALQLTGAAKAGSLANLQVRLPAVVIGGGLTGVDTATEVQAYYLVQIEKTLARYESLSQRHGEAPVRARFSAPDLAVLDEFLEHARALRAERARAAAEGREADTQGLLRAWGGVSIAYRRAMQESPAYVRNHEELSKALEEGIYYAEGLEPKAVRLDQHGQVAALVCQRREREGERGWQLGESESVLPARSIFVATGAKPNVAYEFEHRGHFQREGFQYQPFHCLDQRLQPLPVAHHCKEPDFGPFTSYHDAAGRCVTFLGDTHPVFHGSVVKAVASGMRTYPHILKHFGERAARAGDPDEYAAFEARLADALTARVVRVQRHTPSVIELTVRAPQAARKFQPGQFFRVQNFERSAPRAGDTLLQTEALALLGAKADPRSGEIALMVLEQGASSRLCATFRPGEPLSLMGPTGVKARIYHEGGETLMFVGGRLGAAAIRSIGPAQRAAGNRVLYIAGFQSAEEVYCQDELEAAADAIVWITERGEPVTPRRPQDCAATGAFLETLTRYAAGALSPGGAPAIPLQEVGKVLIVGSQRLVKMMQSAREDALRPYLARAPACTASIHGPMQCMLKGVCAQCLQWQIDPATGQRTKAVFTCSWQDQPLDIVDVDNLQERLGQNRMAETLSNLWLDDLFERHAVERV